MSKRQRIVEEMVLCVTEQYPNCGAIIGMQSFRIFMEILHEERLLQKSSQSTELRNSNTKTELELRESKESTEDKKC